MLTSNIYLPFFVNDFFSIKDYLVRNFFSVFSKSCILKNTLSVILILLFVMGLMSFALGTCVGFYFRNTGLGIELSKRILAVTKLLKDKSLPDYKLVLIVRDDLNMSKGKIASQCSHASVLAYKNASLSDFETANLWEIFGQSKIVLKAPSESKLIELSNQARELRLLTNIVCDAGRTEVNAGTKTVLAIGPGPKATIDKVTAQLKLL